MTDFFGDFFFFFLFSCIFIDFLSSTHISLKMEVGGLLFFELKFYVHMGFPCGSAGRESSCNMGDLGSMPGLGRSPGEGKGYPLQYSGLENSMDCMGLQRVGHD